MKNINNFRNMWIAGLCGCLVLGMTSCGSKMALEQAEIPETPEAEAGKVIPSGEASRYFEEIDEIIQRDGGKLWGKVLGTPFLFVDGESGEVVANEADLEGMLKPEDGVYVGRFPEDQIVANSVTTVGGKEYAMVMWAEFGDAPERAVLFIHELFHYHQAGLGMKKTDGMELVNHQLDELDGRIYLKLEWAALNRAVNSTGVEQSEAIRDALIFRNYRRERYSCADAENEMIIREGLPEYTGIVLALDSKEQQKEQINQAYRHYQGVDSFVRSFAYYSGPAYGFLLDVGNINWRTDLTYNSDLGELLAENRGIDFESLTEEAVRGRYGYEEIRREEEARKERADQQLRQYEEQLFEKPSLTIQLSEPQVGFDPTNLVPYKEVGTIYPNITIHDRFGTLELTEGGCLLAGDWKSARVSAEGISAEGDTVQGPGWVLKLNPGYELTEDGNNYKLP